MKEIGLKFLELLVSAIIAWVFDKFAPSSSPVSAWIIGANVFVILQLLEMTFRMHQHYDTYQKMLSSLTSALASEREESTLLLTALPYSGRTLSRDEVREAWRKLSWHTRRTYSATNYICPADFYNTGHAQNVLQLQKAKLRTQPDFKLRKVFIWKNEVE